MNRALSRGMPLLALVILGCAGPTTPQGAAHSTSTPSSTPIPTPTPLPTPQGVPVGTTVPTTTGNSFQVIAYLNHVASNNQFNVPPAGGFFAAANVKECASTANSASPPIAANPAAWRLVMSDASQADGSNADLLSVPGSPLHFTQLSPGQCISGWVAFSVPGGAVPTEVQLSNTDWYWLLS
jgi:hypothetical protein